MRFPRLTALLIILWFAAAAWAELAVPRLEARVTDLTATLSTAQRGALEGDLQRYEARNGSQIAVLLVPGTLPETIEQYSLRVAEAWKLGHKGVDNGILLLLAKQERKVRIEVGYGLEGSIPDAVARRVIDDTIAPYLKRGDFAGGIAAGVQRLAALVEGRAPGEEIPAAPATPARAAPGPESVPMQSVTGPVIDLTATLADDQVDALSTRLRDFYDSGRTKPLFILLVTSTRPEAIAEYAARTLKTWGERDNLDVDRSLLLVVAKDERTAYIEAGAGLRARILPGAAERAVADIIQPLLAKGEFYAAIETGEQEVERIVDDAIRNKRFSERLVENLSDVPGWLLVALAVVGTLLRWALGPLVGALATAGLVGGGAWLVSGVIEIALAAGAVGFIFVLVGLANWIAMGFSGSTGGSGGGGGFSGGGGSFGGGGASGGW